MELALYIVLRYCITQLIASSPGILFFRPLRVWFLSASFSRWRTAKLARQDKGNCAADRADQTSRAEEWTGDEAI